tara:strand:+ start:386 stop:2953 length:2568 start_codon:yes stop_codon:yes gene_type:complete
MKKKYFLLLALLITTIGYSQNNDFNDGAAGNSNWSDADNWSLIAPVAANTVRFGLVGESFVNSLFTVLKVQTTFATPTGTVNISGASTLTIDATTNAVQGIENVSANDVALTFNGNVTINNSAGVSISNTLMRNQNGSGNTIVFASGSILTLTTPLETRSGSNNNFSFNGAIAGSNALRFNSSTISTFGSTSDNTGRTGDFVYVGANASVVVNTADNNVFMPSGQKIQINATGGSIELNGENVYQGNITLGSTYTFTMDIDNNQNNMGSIILSGTGTLNLDIDAGVTEIAFADNSGSAWNTATVNITGFKDGVLRFGTDSSGLTSGQLSQITVDDGSIGLALDSNGYLYSYNTTWTGATDSDWATAGNWSDGVPGPTDNVYIPNVTNQPTAAANVTINKAFLESGSSLIAERSFTGNITYKRTLGTNNWYLVSSPVSGETIEDMISNHTFDTGTVNPANLGFAPYDNSQAVVADRWDYQIASSTGSLTPGGGYSVKLASPGDISFTGTMEVADVAVSIPDGTGSGGNAYNLVGNPYPSFLAANLNADGTNNILTINTASLTENTLWFWDQSANSGTGGYEQINQASASRFIAPTQGFFVSSSGPNLLNFTEDMQSHQGTDSFQRTTTTRPEINLVMSVGSSTRDADIFYIDGTTTGFDNGYDSSIFGGVVNELAIYTQAVANGTGRNLGIQSLPDNDYENMVIPVGINAVSGSEITISAVSLNLPAGINVYLEDKDGNTFTLLDGSSNFTTTLTSNLNGIGRFYIHTTSEALSIDDLNLDNISIYTYSNNNLRVVGVQSGNAQIKIYNILGKQVLSTSFEGSGVNDITLPNVRTGVYIIQLETENGTLNKKVIIE